MQYQYQPQGTCSRLMIIDVENEIIKSVQIIGGCMGNLQGISRLVEGMKIADVVSKLKGIDCGGRGTSCPDQLSQALIAIAEKEGWKIN